MNALTVKEKDVWSVMAKIIGAETKKPPKWQFRDLKHRGGLMKIDRIVVVCQNEKSPTGLPQ
jgi:hypothetical protein